MHETGSSGWLMVGAGGVEWLPPPYLGIAGKAGVPTSVSGDLVASLGVDARVHVLGTPPAGGWAPYAFVGYAPLRFFELSDQAVQFGAGIDYRLSNRRALRIELRDIWRLRDSSTWPWRRWSSAHPGSAVPKSDVPVALCRDRSHAFSRASRR